MSVDFELKKGNPGYYQFSYTRKGRSSVKFIRKENLAAIRRQKQNYESMSEHADRWIDLATELSNLRLAQNPD